MFGRDTERVTILNDEITNLSAKLLEVDPMSDEYDLILQKIASIETIVNADKENHRRITKESKGAIIGKIVGGVVLGGLALGMMQFEKSGNLFGSVGAETSKNILRIGSKLV